uniref:Translation initiation factor IF-2, chloroplastic n=1 Tax=Riquetophycus sp. TaxID=1897556 RepID=A0A1C9C807_9FLOR|nr:translation initiation factor 2 [Riquetophycus sp.]
MEEQNFNLNEEVNVDALKMALLRPSKVKRQPKRQKIRKNNNDNNILSNQELFHENTNDKELINKVIALSSPLTIQELSGKIHVSEASIITWLFLQGISVTINQMVDVSIATKVAKNYGFNIVDSTDHLNLKSHQPDKVLLDTKVNKGIRRSPIITIFGHVDHGKTTLLDYIRKTNLVDREPGGITQSITGYEVDYNYMGSIEKLIFIDTPGHEAFTCMRSRGAEITDMAVLLVAADDGLKPQSIEAINHIISRKIPYIVAINKIDKSDIKINKIKEQLAQYCIQDRHWGGESIILNISALTGMNVDSLLSNICQLSSSLNLQANMDESAEGIIVESYLDKTIGSIAIVVIKNGTLKLGDIIVSGSTYGRVKSIINSSGIKIESIGASAIVQICGFSSVPQTGLKFYVVDDERQAKNLCSNNNINDNYQRSNILNTRVTLENYSNDIIVKKVNLIVKADTQGSMEAILNAFSQIPQSKVQINIISCSLGSVFDADLDLALTSNSIIIGFNINILSTISSHANKLKIILEKFNVIYDLLDFVNNYMLSLVEPEYDRISLGKASVETVFNMNKGSVAGCFVNIGCLKKGSYIVVYRNDKVVYEGLLDSLRHLKDDVNQVLAGNECGVMSKDYDSWQKADLIESFEMIQRKKVL